jgi:hypothetical protein
MDKKEYFINTLNTYIQRNGDKLTQQDIEPLIMNLAYLEVLKSKKLGQNINEWDTLNGFSEIANQFIPSLNFQPQALLFGYQATIQWDGLWDFLQDYFGKKLGWNIDENDEVDVERFDSSSHTREENGQFISRSEVKRKIELMFKEDKKSLLVRISESLSDKKANLESKVGNRSIYRGTDPDYRFTIIYDRFDTIEEFVLDVLPRSLRIIYHE